MAKSGSGVTYTLSKKDMEIRSKAESLVAVMHSDEVSAVWSKVELAIFLIMIKKEKLKDFYSVIVESILSKKQTQRLMKAVLKLDVDFEEAMKTSGSQKDVEERAKLLVVDEKILSLKSESDLRQIHDLSFTKLDRMKSLSLDEWKDVVTGTDKPYADMLKKQAQEIASDVKKQHDAKKPEGMAQDKFDEAVKAGVYPAVKLMHEFSVENTKLEATIESLGVEIEVLRKKETKTKIQLAKYKGLMEGAEKSKGLFIPQVASIETA
ncbi:MAG TPA: hypothetical protein PLM93_09380 [Sulfuricurvum sp.]|nr:hypothetical protein [Sulfuricurvum sp.]HQT37425.1 hypothetical protein [Sulfuricurvum sp.]